MAQDNYAELKTFIDTQYMGVQNMREYCSKRTEETGQNAWQESVNCCQFALEQLDKIREFMNNQETTRV